MRRSLQKRVAVSAMVAAAACAAYLLQAEAPHKDQPSMAAATPVQAAPEVLRVAGQAAPVTARRVYPYSIVPGGVGSRAELARAVMADKVVAAHYAGFAVEKASLRTVDKARAVYVSYRKGDQVYWTAHKVTLAEGETVLSDGRNDIRGRCGNRISDTPRLPVEVKGPGEQELDTPIEQGQDGALRQASADLDEQDGGGEPFVLHAFPNGAGLLAAAQPQASASQAGPGTFDMTRANLGILSSGSRAPVLLASLDKPASDSGAAIGATDSDTPGTAGEPETDSGGVTTGDTGSGSIGGGSSNDKPGDQAGGTPDGGDPGTPPAPGLPPDPLPVVTPPAKPQELPEPSSLWLTGLAAAALLLQRRVRRSR